MIEIVNVDDPRIAPFATMRARKGWLRESDLPVAAADSLVVAEGEKCVLVLLESLSKNRTPPLAILAENSYYERLADAVEISGIPQKQRFIASEELMKQLVGYRMHQGVMLLAKAPNQTSLEELPFPIIALNQLANAENVGAIVRTAVAFGVRSILIDDCCASPFLRRSVKVAMGTAFQINWHKTESLADALCKLKLRGATIVAAEASDAAVPIDEYTIPRDSVIIMGSEGKGIAPEVVATADVSVTIPIDPSVDSLNVAVASAIVLYRLKK
jgi:tRNA G18 (ribose-2'-O)-methylase SpoU